MEKPFQYSLCPASLFSDNVRQSFFFFGGEVAGSRGEPLLPLEFLKSEYFSLLESFPSPSVWSGADLGKMKLFAFLRYFPYLKDRSKSCGSV